MRKTDVGSRTTKIGIVSYCNSGAVWYALATKMSPHILCRKTHSVRDVHMVTPVKVSNTKTSDRIIASHILANFGASGSLIAGSLFCHRIMMVLESGCRAGATGSDNEVLKNSTHHRLS
jgi:hypothetical protein